jgi:hypothetical protein
VDQGIIPEQNPVLGPLWLENCQELCQSIVDVGCANSNLEFSSPFRHFGCFVSLAVLMLQFV